ncbi:hypothetical protein [Paenibacillus eucommiae]|uniref:Uncharacterized protein n=1 Tax=Paenibacillus eucommiae TaxID=1355755 RepID=A0ABS4J758_9BACL|nr:hypothetical protein [Paenibacillus eucommiae]MBP1995657.1 hypothetical protein [Paenibacillus eucommiae]
MGLLLDSIKLVNTQKGKPEVAADLLPSDSDSTVISQDSATADTINSELRLVKTEQN